MHLDDFIWFKAFHDAYGQCFTADLSKVDKLKFVSYDKETRPYISFYLNDNNPWRQILVLLHTKYDQPDSAILNGKTYVAISNDSKDLHKIEIRKKISKREYSRSMPCTHYEKKTCESIEDNMLVLDKFNCYIPFLLEMTRK